MAGVIENGRTRNSLTLCSVSALAHIMYRCGCTYPGDPQECSAEERRYNNNNNMEPERVKKVNCEYLSIFINTCKPTVNNNNEDGSRLQVVESDSSRVAVAVCMQMTGPGGCLLPVDAA